MSSQRGIAAFNILSLFLVLFAVGVLLRQTMALGWTPARLAGLLIAVPAFALLILARFQLGGAFSIRPKAQTLVTTGIYSRIRNPIYVFSTLGIGGVILWCGMPRLFLFLAVLALLQFSRSRKESQVLAEKFGDAYRDYKQKTWF